MTSYPFFKMAATAVLDLMWIMLDHPRSAMVGISSVLKFGLDQIYSFGLRFLYFAVLALNCLFTPIFGGI